MKLRRLLNPFRKKYESEYQPEEAVNKVFILKDGRVMELEVPDDDREAQDDDKDN